MRSPRRDSVSATDDGSSSVGLPRRAAAPPDRPSWVCGRKPHNMRSPLAESQRDALIEAMLPDVPFDGWSRAALRTAARRIGIPPGEALALFADGQADFVACFSRWADRRTLDRLEGLALDGLRVSERIAAAVNLRLEIIEPSREAVRHALAVLALPPHAPLAMRLLYETV